MMELVEKRVGVFGLGITGRAVLDYLLLHEAHPVCVDEATHPEKLRELQRLTAEHCVEAHLGEIPQDALAGCKLIIVSPGVTLDNPILAAAREAGTECISEIELAYRNCRAKLVGITGSNGKSTTTMLLAHLLSGFRRAVAVGNIGKPFISVVDDVDEDDVVCCEVSSFQLEASPDFHPHIAIFTNITPDHLERHHSFSNYAAMKRSLIKTMAEGDIVIHNAEDENLQPDEFPRRPVTFLPFSSVGEVGPPGAYLENGEMIVDAGNGEVRIARDVLHLPGLHNVENALAAALAARLLGAKKNHLEKGLGSFEGYEHRIEFVRELDGVRYYNDSKATNPEAAVTALKSFPQAVVLIAGGRDKGTDLTEFVSQAQKGCSQIVLLGEAAGRFEQALRNGGFDAILRAGSLEEAVETARTAAEPGEVVLLSPACASFDMFESFEERGNLFKELVQKL